MSARNSADSDQNQQLSDIDRNLLQLLKQRLDTCSDNAEQRDWRLTPVAIAEIRQQADNLGVDPALAVSWIRHASNICQQQLGAATAIAYLGPIYSYSYLAAVKHFGLDAALVPVTNIAAAFEEVQRGHAKFAVVPIENSTDGRVVDTLGMFAKSPVEICGEVNLPIHHCLLGKMQSRDQICRVLSKPQALSQCRGWLAEHLSHAETVEVSSTATAASTAAEQDGVAAIASREAGIHHGLQVVEQNIEDQADNVTRFAVIGNRENDPTGADKSSMMFQVEHRPGALAEAMVTFQESGVNLTWIESFPLPDRPNEYLFFVELEGHQQDSNVQDAVARLREQTMRLDVLGSYPRCG